MKKIFMLAVALCGLTACSSDDDKAAPAVDLDNLTQRWYYKSYKVGGETVNYEGHESCGKDYIEFLDGGVAKDVDYFDCQQDPAVDTGTYTATEETLTINIDEVEVYELKKLSASTLQIEGTLNGATITYNYTSTP